MQSNKRYNTLSDYYKNIYNKKVCKISLNANFTCPNKDGFSGYGGCSYCSSLGSGDFAGDKELSLEEQFNNVKEIMNKKWPDTYYIAYLQANTNTYAPVEKLKEIYESILTINPLIKELSIATRADCLEDEKIEYLKELNKKIKVQIELGLQTIHDKTSILINRCHSLELFDSVVKKLKDANIEVVVHIINGLPYETKDMMLDTIRHLNNLDINGIKIHSLTVIKNTKMGNDYLDNPFKLLTLEEYVDIVCDQIALLKKDIIIHRIQADAKIEDLIAPLWTTKKFVVMNEIDKELKRRNIYQADNYTK